MKYKAFKNTNDYYSIMDQDTGKTLKLMLPYEELASIVCSVLHDVYHEGVSHGESKSTKDEV